MLIHPSDKDMMRKLLKSMSNAIFMRKKAIQKGDYKNYFFHTENYHRADKELAELIRKKRSSDIYEKEVDKLARRETSTLSANR